MKKITNFILIISIIFTACVLFFMEIRLIVSYFNTSDPPLPLGFAIIDFIVKLFIIMIPIVMFFFSLIPYIMLLKFNKANEENFRKDMTVLITTIIISIFAVFVIIEAIFIHTDPGQSGFVFMFVPICQIVLALFGIGLAKILYSLDKRV